MVAELSFCTMLKAKQSAEAEARDMGQFSWNVKSEKQTENANLFRNCNSGFGRGNNQTSNVLP
jgi:hypothetical protein